MTERAWRGVLWTAIGVAVVAGTVQAIRDEMLGHPLEAGAPAPPLVATRLDGTPFPAEELKGRVVLLSFWATWCGPCKEELPALLSLEAEHRSRGVLLVAASTDEGTRREATVERFFRERGGPAPRVVFPDLGTISAFKASRLPALYVLGRDGRVVAGWSSVQPESAIRRAIDVALAQGSQGR